MLTPIFVFSQFYDYVKEIIHYVVYTLLLFVVAFSIETFLILKNIEKYPKYAEVLNKKLSSLKTRLSKLTE
jgi:hypothetical protein